MGAAISDQVSNQIIKNSLDIATNVSQTCQSTTSNNFNIDAKNNCVQTLGNITIKNNISIDTSCIQNSTVQNSLQSQLQTQILNQATAAAQSLGGPSITFSRNIQNFSQETSKNISNLFTQSCVSQHSSTVTIKCSDNAIQTIGAINDTNQIADYTNCTNNNSVISDAKETLSNYLKNETFATEADTFGSVVVIFLVVIGFFAIFFVQTLNGPIGWIIIIIVAAIVIGAIIYAIYAYQNGSYPFSGRS